MTATRPPFRPAQQLGVTLIELVTSIVIIALAASALMGVLGFLSTASGRSLAQAQAQAIANAYLAEALSKPFTDPNGMDGETSRAQFDDVDDYHGLDDSMATDQAGGAAGALRVRMTVVPDTLGGLPATRVRRVDVSVDYGDGQQALATGYRMRYP